jgi:hypothetical protein
LTTGDTFLQPPHLQHGPDRCLTDCPAHGLLLLLLLLLVSNTGRLLRSFNPDHGITV